MARIEYHQRDRYVAMSPLEWHFRQAARRIHARQRELDRQFDPNAQQRLDAAQAKRDRKAARRVQEGRHAQP